MKEIGSEFWKINETDYNNNLKFLDIGKDYKLVMSGRTAIDFVINEIRSNKKVVYMPDYCCESMVKPFIDNDYQVIYYNVDLENNKLNVDFNMDCSVFFAISYFGYNNPIMDDCINEFSKRNVIIIEDITHRLFCKNNHNDNSDYLIASLRKWFPIYTGGVAINMKTKFNSSIEKYTAATDLIKYKKEAMLLKREYMENIIEDKQKFLDLYSQANNLFSEYKNKLMDEESIRILKSINIDKMVQTRRKNVRVIEENVKNKNISLIYKLSDNDCPLFVPILLSNRDNIRKKLIEKSIYCPIHWPNFNNFENKIYDKELSLICDQRYREKDINEYTLKLIDSLGE